MTIPPTRQFTCRRLLPGLLCLACFASLAMVWHLGGRLVAPASRIVGEPPKPLNLHRTTLSSPSGSRIATWYSLPEGTTGTIILLHPIRGDRSSMLGRAELFRDAGYAVVLIDLQAHGESSGKAITMGHLERHDVCAAVTFAHKLNPSGKIGIVGWSLGGAAALLASPLDIDALLLESVYPTIDAAVANRLAMRIGNLNRAATPLLVCQLRPRLGISAKELRPIDHIATANCPVLIMAGDQDQRTPLEETNRLFAAAKAPKEQLIFNGAAHVDLFAYDREHYSTKALAFFAAHLKSSPVKGD